MRFTRLASLTFASSLLMAGAALAQDPAPPAPAPDPPAAPAPAAPAEESEAKLETVSGQLVKVDAEKKTLSVKLADGAEWTFAYTADTEISGDKKGEQGLATAEGGMVTVHYSEKDGTKTASKVEVQPRTQQ